MERTCGNVELLREQSFEGPYSHADEAEIVQEVVARLAAIRGDKGYLDINHVVGPRVQARMRQERKTRKKKKNPKRSENEKCGSTEKATPKTLFRKRQKLEKKPEFELALHTRFVFTI